MVKMERDSIFVKKIKLNIRNFFIFQIVKGCYNNTKKMMELFQNRISDGKERDIDKMPLMMITIKN